MLEAKDFHTVVGDLDGLAVRAAAWPELRQKIVFTKGMVWLNALGDELRARDALREARALGPDTAAGQRANELLDQLP